MTRVLAASLFTVLATALPVTAQVTIDATVDTDVIDLTGQVTLTVTVLGEAPDGARPELPPLNDFVVVGTGSRQNLVIQNGQISRSTSYTYTLMPRRAGNLTIGAVTLATASGPIATRPLTIAVTQAPPARSIQRATDADSGRTVRRPSAEPFFVEATVNKDTLYLGEQVTYTFSYYRAAMLSESNNYTPPQTTGFISVDLPPQRKRTRVIDGENYSVVEVVTAMFPTRPGPMTIGPARLRVVPDVFSNLLGRDPFDWFRGRSRSPLTAGEPRNLVTRPIELVVKPLPPVPAGKTFSGAVGTCALAVELSDDSVGVGDPVTVTWTLTGTGRKDLVDAPVVRWPEGIETYPPTTDLSTSTRNDVVAETKVFHIAIVPRREGTVTIPAPELTYFNPEAGAYQTARGRARTLRVGPPRAGMVVTAPTQTISAAASSIRYLKGLPPEWQPADGGLTTAHFVLLQIAPPLVLLVLYGWKRRTEAPEQRARGARQREVRKARRRLAAAGRLAGSPALPHEIAAAFRQYLAARFALTPGDLLDTAWTEELVRRGCRESDTREALAVLAWADRARFGGGGGGPDPVTPDRVLKLMEKLDRCAG